MALYVNGNNVTYFDSFEVEHIPKKTQKFIDKIPQQVLIECKLAVELVDVFLLDLLFYAKTISVKIKESIALSVRSTKKITKPEVSYIFDKTFFLLFLVSLAVVMKKYLKKNNQLRYLKFLV